MLIVIITQAFETHLVLPFPLVCCTNNCCRAIVISQKDRFFSHGEAVEMRSFLVLFWANMTILKFWSYIDLIFLI